MQNIKIIEYLVSLITKNKIKKFFFKDKDFSLGIHLHLNNLYSNCSTDKFNNDISNNNSNNTKTDTNKREKVSSTNNNLKVREGKIFTLKSPIVGTFYSSPSPESKPFIKINDKVSEHQTVCIIEAMKVMNEIKIPASINGRVLEITISDGDVVEYNQSLIKIELD